MTKWYGYAGSVEQRENLDFYESMLTKGDQWKFNTIRIPFIFPVNFNILDEILVKVKNHSLKTILDFHVLNQYPPVHQIGTQGFIDDWLEVINRYKDNPTVIAWEIANEPNNTNAVWIPSCVGTTSAIGINKIAELVNVVDAIRAVDPERTIVFSPSNYWNNVNPIPTQYRRSNVVLSHHPYSYGNQTTWQGLMNIANYRISKFNTYKSQFDDQWLGELECHPGGVDQTIQPMPSDWERDYVVYMLNYGIENDYGFNYWKYGYSQDDGHWDQNVVIGETDYKIPEGGEKLSFVNETDQTVAVYKRPKVVDTFVANVPVGGKIDITLDEETEELVIKKP